jgi:hypothetical protein
MKNQKMFTVATVVAVTVMFASCTKESTTVSKPQFKAGSLISGDSLTSGASNPVKGTMQTGKTYYFSGPVYVNKGDTLVMQSGVKLLAKNPNAMLIINGVFISLGTKDQPNWITGEDAYNNPAKYKLTAYTSANNDPGLTSGGAAGTYPRLWGGIQCGTTATMFNVKWTHLDFAGGLVSNTSPVVTGFVYSAGNTLFATCFQNPLGVYILEDSWIYGTTSDAARIAHGSFHFMRNTVEKLGYNDGDAFNTKAESSGNMAYNLFIGTSKGGTKAAAKSPASGGPFPYARVHMYNNTYINCGYRSLDPDRGANVDLESAAGGYVYNNIIVNCRTGIRFVESPVADTVFSQYGNNLYYADSANIAGQFMPSSHLAKYNTTDIPLPSSYYTFPNQKYWFVVKGTPQAVAGGDWTNGYNSASLVGKNNPKFTNYTLPAPVGSTTYGPRLGSMTWQGNFDFHLQTGSPAIGAGFTNFQPVVTPISQITNPDLAATFTAPNKDLGAYPTDGSGNLH